MEGEREREREREGGGGGREKGEFRVASGIVPPVDDLFLFICFKDPPLLPLLHHIYFPWISNLDRYLSM